MMHSYSPAEPVTALHVPLFAGKVMVALSTPTKDREPSLTLMVNEVLVGRIEIITFEFLREMIEAVAYASSNPVFVALRVN